MKASGRIARGVVVALTGACLVGASGRTEAPPPRAAGPQEAEVVGLLVTPQAAQPTVVLQGKRDGRTVAIAIGPAEATGIALPLQRVTPPRPLTHDLFLTMFGRLRVTLQKVVITDLRDDIYYAIVYLSASGGEIQLDARPSDAIALAIRAGAPVLVEDRVFDKTDRLPGPAPSGPRI